MSRSRLAAALVAALMAVVVGLAPAGAAEEPLTVLSADASAYPDVRLVVAAPAQLGDQVLNEGSFRVVEGGRAPAVRAQALPADQLEVALVIDTSGSMTGAPLTAAKAAAQSFLNQLPAAVPVSVVGFGATAKVLSARSTNRAAHAAAVAGLTASGQTALYDALGSALSQLSTGAGARRMIVLLTDGGDTTSVATLDATAATLAAAGAPLFAVELRTVESNPAALGRLTSASGGRVVPATDPAALAGAFDAVARQLVRQYTVAYTSTARGTTDIDVVLEAQGVRAVARHRLELPAPPAPATTVVTQPRALGAAPASTVLGGWALLAGGALWGMALLTPLLVVLVARTPRAQGLAARRRGASLARAAERAEALGDSLLRRGGKRSHVNDALEAAGVDMRPGELLSAAAGASLVALALGWVLRGPTGALVLAGLVPLLVRVALDVLAGRRRKRFSAQLPETLQILAGSLRAGHGLARGIDAVGREAESPTAEEFRRLTIESRLGRDFVDALRALSARIGSEDFEWVVQAIEIQRDVGGDLAEVLDTVAGTIRDRARIRNQVAALSAEGRMSAWVLMLLPFGLTAVMRMTNPRYLSPLFGTGTGHVLLAVGAVLLTAGGLWLRQIVKPTF